MIARHDEIDVVSLSGATVLHRAGSTVAGSSSLRSSQKLHRLVSPCLHLFRLSPHDESIHLCIMQAASTALLLPGWLLQAAEAAKSSC